MSAVGKAAEERRQDESRRRVKHWNRWGPYLAERAWGTVREDYSPGPTPWEYFPHDHARSRAYRWNEDGLLGLCDRHQRISFALALWNGRDPFLKERLFGLSNHEGNHGEDVKECYFYLDNTPTHSYMKGLYKYPQAPFPYAELSDGTSTAADLPSTKVDAHSENFPTRSHEKSTGNRSHSPAAPLPLCMRRRIEKMFIRLTSVLMLAMCFTACSGYNNSPSAPTAAPAGSTTVTIPSGAFTQTTTAFGQNPLTIAVGTTISWLNDDSITHTSDADANQWSSGNIPPGGRFNFTFPSAGRFTYHCQIHPNMVGTIVVQ